MSKIFSTLCDNSAQGRKRRNLSINVKNRFRHSSTFFVRHQFSGPFSGFWGTLIFVVPKISRKKKKKKKKNIYIYISRLLNRLQSWSRPEKAAGELLWGRRRCCVGFDRFQLLLWGLSALMQNRAKITQDALNQTLSKECKNSSCSGDALKRKLIQKEVIMVNQYVFCNNQGHAMKISAYGTIT